METTALSTTVRFADGFDRPETIAFGLEGPQLAVIALGAGVAWGLLHSPLPGALQVLLAVLVGLVAAVAGVGRWAGRPLLTWAWVAGRFWLGPRHGGGVLMARATDGGGSGGTPRGGEPAGDVPGGGAAGPGGLGDGDEPGWARWLREGGALRHARARDGTPPVAGDAARAVRPAFVWEPPPGQGVAGDPSPPAVAHPELPRSTWSIGRVEPRVTPAQPPPAAPGEPPSTASPSAATSPRTIGAPPPNANIGANLLPVDPPDASAPPAASSAPAAAAPPPGEPLASRPPVGTGPGNGAPRSAPPAPPAEPPASAVELWLGALGGGRVGEPEAQRRSARRARRWEESDRPMWPVMAGTGPLPATPAVGAETPAAPSPLMTTVRRWLGRIRGEPVAAPGSAPSEPASPAPPPPAAVQAAPPPPLAAASRDPIRGRTIELDRPPLVLLPTAEHPLGGSAPGESAPDLDETKAKARDDEEVQGLATVIPLVSRVDDDLDEDLMLELAEDDGGGRTAVVDRERPAATPHAEEDRRTAASGSDPGTPVFVGATRRITFFSLNGGSGRTTLATEIACLLAAQGKHRPDPEKPPERLRVALVDLDLRASNVAVRLGIPHPTLWDYLLATGEDAEDVRHFLVHHASGLRALLGPPKPLSTAAAAVEPARVAEIVHQLERDGCHFIVFDVGSDLGPVSTWVLSQVHDIYVVITPTASGMQDAYRTTEALRRLGLGYKLRYVVNRARGNIDVAEVMGDLGGRITATIPCDHRLEDAENSHSIASLRGGGPGADAIFRLASAIYPALGGGRGRRTLLGRRRAG